MHMRALIPRKHASPHSNARFLHVVEKCTCCVQRCKPTQHHKITQLALQPG